LTESDAPEAILAACAVIAKHAVGTVLQVLACHAVVAVVDVEAVVTKFRVFTVIYVHAVARIQHNATIETVFVKIRGKEEVAVFIFVRVRAVIGIFRTNINVIQPRRLEPKLLELL
jgi:hypothetical protein